ncbi:hypothetical protein LTR85_008944 [Meristemomyces frigidus]|nr:hypothetical protein LTR85_008944 [Meristemomyces frigidus]
MSTPHRGLPPPSSMTLPDPRGQQLPDPRGQQLPDPTRQQLPDPTRQQAPPLGQPLGAMPTPPNQWQGQEDSMRNWLVAKAEEDRRKQEEEKTRQEGYRLEQRRIEQSMLRESLQAGVPPQMVPMIYAGIGGSNLANVSIDWLQQYAGQLQAAQQQIQQQQTSPELRRESRMIGQGAEVYSQPVQQQVVPSQPAQPTQPPQPLQTTFSAYQPTQPRAPPTSVPRSATHTQLPRLTTNEMYVNQPPLGNPGSAHPLQQSQTIQQDQPASSPSIYFHHWVPPGESKGQPQTPASKGGEPHSAHPGSHLSEGDYKESPRKRKAQGGHQPNPPPSAGPQFTSPSFSTASSTSRKGGTSGGHARSRSNTSVRDIESRPGSRRDPDPPRSQPDPAEERRPRSSSQQRDERSGRPSTEERPDSRRAER